MKLWPHQERVVDIATKRSGYMIAHDMGAGKTCSALAVMKRLGLRRTLIVCPKAVIPVWPLQAERHGSHYEKIVALSKGGVKNRATKARFNVDPKVPCAVVINYEAVWRPDFASFLRDWLPDSIICDEIHRCKGPGSKCSLFLSKLSSRSSVRFRLGLTGTPMPHSPMDLYAQFRLLDKSVYGTSFARFRSRYAIMGGYDRRNVVGYKNTEDLISKFHANADVVKAEDVLDLMPTQDIRRSFRLSRKEFDLYLRVKLSVVAQIESGEITMRNGLVKLLRLQQSTSGVAKIDTGELLRVGNSKSLELLDILRDIHPSEHVVVFCRFTADIETVLSVAKKRKVPGFELSGKVKQIEEWNSSGGVLAVQVDAGGEGVDLTASRYCIYYSLSFSYGKYLQSRKRLDRPGQERPVIYWHLVAEGTIDEDVYRSLEKKQDAIEHVLYALRK